MVHLIKKDEVFSIAKVKGFVPANSIGVVPSSIDQEDYPYIKATQVVDEFDNSYWEIYVDEDAKAAGESEAKQEERNSKLKLLRGIRDQKLSECDNIVRDLALGLRSDQIPIRDYRDSLKSITDDYKYVNDSSKGKAALDFFSGDLSDFTWPTKP